MEISLIRHGKFKHIDNHKMTCYEFKDWIRKYDISGVIEEKSYPLETLDKLAAAPIVMTSDLERSIESAKLLNPNIKRISSSLFRETELPVPSKNLWNIKLKPSHWAIILRCLWLIGYSNGYESLSRAEQRAHKAAAELIDYAQKYKQIVLVGHGFMNRLIAKELQKMGWKSDRKAHSKHWSLTTYIMPGNELV